MAYDPVKAHEYYMKYRKKGLKKGRKKGSSKKSTANIVGLSTVGLNDAGKMEVALLKEDLKKKMNAELAGAKTDIEKAEIRKKFQQQALEAVQKIKGDSKYAKPKATRASSASSKSSRSTGSKSSRSSGSARTSSTSSKASSTSSQVAALQTSVQTLSNMVTQLTEKIAQMTDEQKEETKIVLTDIVAELKKHLTGGTGSTDLTSLEQELEDKLKV